MNYPEQYRENIAVTLDAAREAIERYGWIQGALQTPDGLCALGAIEFNQEDQRSAAVCVARSVLASVIPARPQRALNEPPELHPVAEWNDDPARTREDVILAFKQAAEKIRTNDFQPAPF